MAVKEFVSQSKEVFDKLTLLQRVSIGAAVAAVLISLIVFVLWANKPVYKTLYGKLSSDDAAQIMESLKEKKIPYKLGDGGAAINVPQEMVYETRLTLAQEGLPRGGGAGFELFDKSSYGMTEFMQDVNYQRALQGELSRTISNLDAVSEARIHLTIPKNRLFVSEGDMAKAAIVLKLRGGARLAPETAKAIASLVAGSVKGLKAENVKIVDTSGRLLSDAIVRSNDPVSMTQSQVAYRKRIESDLESKVNDILIKTVGNGNAVARVSVEIDFSAREITKEEFDKEPVVRSTQSLEIESKNSPNVPGGVPGVQSNLAEPDALKGKMNSEYNKTQETTNYEISKVITKEKKAFGVLKRVTVAVVVDDKKVLEKKGEDEVVVSKPRTENDLKSIKNLVAMAVGYNEKRGDMIEVSNISFDTTVEKKEATQMRKDKITDLIIMGVKYFVALLILVAFYFLVIRKLLSRLDKTVTVREDGSIIVGPSVDAEGTDLSDQHRMPKSLEDLELEIESELESDMPVDVESVKSKVMLKKIEEFADEDPEAAANLIKTFIRSAGN